jgi:hypothetical protein
MTAPNGTADEYAAAQVKEWNKYVAAFPIDYYGTRAYNVGDPVPVSAVEGDGAWVPTALVKTAGKGKDAASPFEGSQTVVDPAQSSPASTPAAAPTVSSPDPAAPTT